MVVLWTRHDSPAGAARPADASAEASAALQLADLTPANPTLLAMVEEGMQTASKLEGVCAREGVTDIDESETVSTRPTLRRPRAHGLVGTRVCAARTAATRDER
jgi:hypothetical protein